MAEKKYIDNTGLAKIFELIAGKYETQANFADLTALIGAAKKGNEEAKTVLERIAALEGLAGTDSVEDQIAAAIDALAGSATSTDGSFVNVTVTTENGEVKSVSVAEDDIASAALLGTAADAATAETAFGKIAKAQAAAEAAQGDVDALEELVGEVPAKVGETATATVVAYVDAKVAAADGAMDTRMDAAEAAIETLNGADTVAGSVAAQVKAEADRAKGVEEDLQDAIDLLNGGADEAGSVAAAVKAEADRIDGVIGTVPAKVGETATATVVAYVDAKIAAVNGDAEELEGRVGDLEDAVELLNGDDKTTGSVANTVATELAKIINDNDASDIDTLEEIAAWIISDTTGAAKMANDIARLDGADTLEGSVKKQIKDAVAAEAEIARAAEKANADAIAEFVALTDDEITAAFNKA